MAEGRETPFNKLPRERLLSFFFFLADTDQDKSKSLNILSH